MAGVLCRVVGVGADLVTVLTFDGAMVEVDRGQCYDQPEVGHVAELVEDGGSWWAFERVEGARFVECSAVRPRSSGTVVFEAGRKPDVLRLDETVTGLGFADYAEAQRLQGHVLEFALVEAGGSVHLAWPEGGLERLRERWAAKGTAKRLNEARAHARRDDVFVNPYTYVPLPSVPAPRTKPSGHDRLGDGRYCGWFDVTYTAESPLMVRDGRPDGRFMRRVGEPFVPGSSLKGAIRSVHEALTGSCLRVVDADHVPVYRQQAKVLGKEWTLAVVRKVGHNNRIDQVQLCDGIARVPVDLLHAPRALGGWHRTRTGASVALTVPAPRAGDAEFGWPIAEDAHEYRPGGGEDEWVIHVSHAGARKAQDDDPYRCAAGRLSDSYAGVTTEAWTAYLDLVEGTDDLRIARAERRGVDQPVDKPVEYPKGTRVGVRRTAARGFAPGDVIWAKIGPRGVEAIQLSQVWRAPGSGSVRERVAGFLPCDDVDELCPTCRLFGAADTRGDRPGRRSWGEAVRQDGYAGHVRIGDAVAVGEVTFRDEQLSPLGAPRLGSGQFTLDHEGRLGPSDPPANRWGATHDANGPRRVRGRRFYWHGFRDDPDRPARHRRRGHAKEKMTSAAELAQPGATFRARVHVDGVTLEQLGSLLAAIDPALALTEHRPPGFRDEGRIAPRLGGGKPFGLGTMAVEVRGLHVETATSRYGDGEAAAVGVGEAVAAFVQDDAVPDAVRREVWPALAAVLHTGQVNDERIWYPPGDTWDAVGEPSFDKPFAFFSRSAGTNEGKNRGDMIPLPDPTALDQSLPINGEAGR